MSNARLSSTEQRHLAQGQFDARADELFRRTDAGGIRRGIPYADVMKLIQNLLNGKQSAADLIDPAEMSYRMFISPAKQLEMAWDRNKRFGWRFSRNDFDALGDPPNWPTDPLVAVVLDVSLSDEFRTVGAVIRCMEETYPFAVEAAEFYASPICRRIRLIEGKEHERGLRWQKIDLGANWKKDGNSLSPFGFQNPKISPGQVIYWAASYFPRWLQAMNRSGGRVPNVWVTGYNFNLSFGIARWSEVPVLHKDRTGQRVYLRSGGNDLDCPLYQGGCWAIPELIVD